MNKETKPNLPPVLQDIFARLKSQAALSGAKPSAQGILGAKSRALTGLKAKI